MLRAFHGLPGLRDPANFDAWLQRTLVNTANSHLAAERREREKAEAWSEGATPDLNDTLEAHTAAPNPPLVRCADRRTRPSRTHHPRLPPGRGARLPDHRRHHGHERERREDGLPPCHRAPAPPAPAPALSTGDRVGGRIRAAQRRCITCAIQPYSIRYGHRVAAWAMRPITREEGTFVNVQSPQPEQLRTRTRERPASIARSHFAPSTSGRSDRRIRASGFQSHPDGVRTPCAADRRR